MAKSLTYKSAGVDIDEGERFVQAIKPAVASTKRPGVLGSLGGFSGLFRAPTKGMKDPLLVSSTDGVGTKLLVANLANKHDTVGIDLVAMCVNDLATCGAEPLFLLDYLATGRMDSAKLKDVVKGIAKGCKQAGCALIGGETAEMPGLYEESDYDLAAFAVGVVDRPKLVDGKRIKAGDAVLGLASSGIHSNGLSLARKVFTEAELRGKWGRELLKPTRIYVKPLLALVKAGLVKGMAHVTGGGFYENIPRCLPKGKSVAIDRSAWRVPKVFKEIQARGNVADAEMFRTFNMGIGMAAIVGSKDAAKAQKILARFKIKSPVIGEVVKGKREVVMSPA